MLGKLENAIKIVFINIIKDHILPLLSSQSMMEVLSDTSQLFTDVSVIYHIWKQFSKWETLSWSLYMSLQRTLFQMHSWCESWLRKWMHLKGKILSHPTPKWNAAKSRNSCLDFYLRICCKHINKPVRFICQSCFFKLLRTLGVLHVD